MYQMQLTTKGFFKHHVRIRYRLTAALRNRLSGLSLLFTLFLHRFEGEQGTRCLSRSWRVWRDSSFWLVALFMSAGFFGCEFDTIMRSPWRGWPPEHCVISLEFGARKSRSQLEPQDMQAAAVTTTGLASDNRVLIDEARAGLDAMVNSALTMLYWRICRHIRAEELKGGRTGYGEQIVASLARQLEAEHGRGFGAKILRHMLRFGEAFEAEEIVYALSRQLSWTHLRSLIYIDDPLKREFYLEMCRGEGWSTRTLQGRLDSMLFDRTALSRKPNELLTSELATLRDQGVLGPNLVLKDRYVLDFLGLRDRYLEKDLEDAILRELENFLLELGAGFSFVARQKQLQIDNNDFTLTCCSTTAAWLPSNSSSVNSRRPTKARWSSTCVGWPSMNRNRAKRRH